MAKKNKKKKSQPAPKAAPKAAPNAAPQPYSGNSNMFTNVNDYPYWKNIKSPDQLGMSDKGTFDVMSKDINGLISYVELLVSGKSKASSTGGPLGNKYFLNTGATCIDDATKKEVDRYIYINNVPKGNIPFVSYGMGTNFKDFKGLIPGAMGNLNTLNPLTVIQEFSQGTLPSCKNITLETINTTNKKSKETHYISVADLKLMDPCDFLDKTNSETKQKCKELFTNMRDDVELNSDGDDFPLTLPKDPIVQIYFIGLGLLGMYIIYKIMEKNR
jgi:hypothetical protein